MARLGTIGQTLASVAAKARKAGDRSGSPSPERLKLWTDLMNPDVTTRRAFLESFKIATKGTDKASGTNMVPYRLRDAQLRLDDQIDEMWGRGEAAKILVLKDRQQGISAYIESLMFERFHRGGGGYGKTVSHKDEATDDLVRTFVGFRLQVPEWVYRDVLKAKFAVERPYSIEMRQGAVITKLDTMTARDGAMGRGGAPRWMHVSEYPWWTSGKQGLGAALTAIGDTPGNFAIIESTGKEFDEFYDLCVSARGKKSTYGFVFFDWLSNPTKTFSFPTPTDRSDFIDTIGQMDEYGRHEEAELVARNATAEQMNWRRREIDSPNTPGRDLRSFAREHPLKFEDAFYADSDSIFVPAENLDERRDRLMDQEAKAGRGDFETSLPDGTDLSWAPNKLGRWTIYAKPVAGRAYCWGADACAGLKVLTLGKREGDGAVIDIRSVETQEIVAAYRAVVPPEELAVEIMCGAKWYGWARGYPERNNDGKVVMRDLPALQDAWNCPTDIVLCQKKLVPTRNGDEWEHHPGFYTDSKTKPIIINHLRRLTREMGRMSQGEPRLLYIGLMEEMRRYVREAPVNRNGRPTGRVTLCASSGHDDRVMAAALCLEARTWLYDKPDEQTKVDASGKGTIPMNGLTRWNPSTELRLVAQETTPDETMGAQF